jgi:hypothetical protein
MNLTNEDKLNFIRFGCSFLPHAKAICVPWTDGDEDRIASAAIVARFISTRLEPGSLLTVAFEISRTKSLPRYCFFPFDLRNTVHSEYLAGICSGSDLVLIFVTDAHVTERICVLSKRQHSLMPEMYKAAIDAANSVEDSKYDYMRAIEQFEQSTRIAECFDCAFSREEVRSLIASAKEKAELASPQIRQNAALLAKDLWDIFDSRDEGWAGEQARKLPEYIRTAKFLVDLRDEIGGDPEAIRQFLADSIAANASQTDLKNLPTLIVFIKGLAGLIDRLQQGTAKGDGQLTPKNASLINRVLGRALQGHGLSIGSFQSLLSIIGFQLGGKPGRSGEDYSNEYQLRATGHKWREIAEYALQNDAAIREEFGVSKFRQLTKDQQHLLMNRVRERVRSHANRTGQPFPSPPMQKNPS